MTNIAGMAIAAFLYDVFMLDTRRVVNLESMEHRRLLFNKFTGDRKPKDESRVASFIDMSTVTAGATKGQSAATLSSEENREHKEEMV
jgi:hypothetical protein